MPGLFENRRRFRQQGRRHLLFLIQKRAQISVLHLSRLCLANALTESEQPFDRLRIVPVELVHRPRRRGRFGEQFHALRIERPPFVLQTLRQCIARSSELGKGTLEQRVDLGSDIRSAPRHGRSYDARLRSASMISRSVGKRPSCFLLKICWLSTETMKMPPLPRTISLSKPSSFLISAARLEARGR